MRRECSLVLVPVLRLLGANDNNVLAGLRQVAGGSGPHRPAPHYGKAVTLFFYCRTANDQRNSKACGPSKRLTTGIVSITHSLGFHILRFKSTTIHLSTHKLRARSQPLRG